MTCLWPINHTLYTCLWQLLDGPVRMLCRLLVSSDSRKSSSAEPWTWLLWTQRERSLYLCKAGRMLAALALLCVPRHFTRVRLWPYGLWPTRLLCPWHSVGKNIGVGCRVLFQDIPQPGIKPTSPHCEWILYQLSQQGSPALLWSLPNV